MIVSKGGQELKQMGAFDTADLFAVMLVYVLGKVGLDRLEMSAEDLQRTLLSVALDNHFAVTKLGDRYVLYLGTDAVRQGTHEAEKYAAENGTKVRVLGKGPDEAPVTSPNKVTIN